MFKKVLIGVSVLAVGALVLNVLAYRRANEISAIAE